MNRAYPRGCGGTFNDWVNSAQAKGLSPRVRGNPLAAIVSRRRRRPIPAGAGEPPAPHIDVIAGTAYPRGCGGTRTGLCRMGIWWGLSPRVRGNLAIAGTDVLPPGPIPAGAGEPQTRSSPAPGCAAYPRGCGGTSNAGVLSGLFWGLSPRVRGNLTKKIRAKTMPGPIPAGAGEPGGGG